MSEDSFPPAVRRRRAEPAGVVLRALRIGLTGPIGCGKSTVAGWLVELGGTVVDADRLAHEVTAPGTATLAPIRERFGGGVFRDDGSLDRAALARVVFDDPAALRDLEAIVHPAVRARVDAELAAADAAGAPFVVLEAIKLVEGGLAARCHEVWLIECDPATQRSRLRGRGVQPDDAERRIAAQGADLVERLAPRATRRISTEGTADEARARVAEALETALSGGRRKARTARPPV